MEIMLHRRLLYDDARGVGQPLNETGVLREWGGAADPLRVIAIRLWYPQ